MKDFCENTIMHLLFNITYFKFSLSNFVSFRFIYNSAEQYGVLVTISDIDSQYSSCHDI